MSPAWSKVAQGGAIALGAAYVVSYALNKAYPPEAVEARALISRLRRETKAEDEAAISACLQQMKKLPSNAANKLTFQANLDVFLQLLAYRRTGDQELRFSNSIVSNVVDFIKVLCRKDANGQAALVRAGGVRTMYNAMTRTYRVEVKQEGSLDLVSKFITALDDIVSFNENKVVLPFDVPEEARAAEQLTSIKTFGSIMQLLRPEVQLEQKRSQILGIISSVTSLRAGASIVGSVRTDEGKVHAVDALLAIAGLRSGEEYVRATKCVRNLLRHEKSVRDRILSDAKSISSQLTLKEQFIDLLDGGGIGHPPRTTTTGEARNTDAVRAALEALLFMMESHSVVDLLTANNDRGLLALFGLIARCEDPTVREMAKHILKELSHNNALVGVIKEMRSFNGTGPKADVWGTGFKVASELQQRERKDMANMQKNRRQAQLQQQQFMQQMMMAEAAGTDPEQLEQMMQMQAMLGGMPGMEMPMM